jgi:hypothetical protein
MSIPHVQGLSRLYVNLGLCVVGVAEQADHHHAFPQRAPQEPRQILRAVRQGENKKFDDAFIVSLHTPKYNCR